MGKKQDELLRDKFGLQNEYLTASGDASARPGAFPQLEFYLRVLFGPLRRLYWLASRDKCTDQEWSNASAWFADILEKIGCQIQIEGLNNIDPPKKTCVYVANHMSTLETFILPAIIRPKRKVTFVVKKSLVTMPFFGPIMRSRNPVVVGRENPREDLATVLSDGCKIIKQGTSIIVFPQHTRSLRFDSQQFNSIGVKLARKAGVPVVPIALKTDAWGQGKRIKELGRIRPELPIRFKIAPALEVDGTGKKTHEQICEFISQTLEDWQKKDGVNE